ncbi:hypothetical protein G6F62_015916 [Rhizopus arrhizus]|nr:hypothetical protein G6F62_015916 [Rhizopus arrhizus]
MGNGTVALTVLRDRAEPVRRFRIRAGNWSELRAALQAVRPDGASALAQWQPQIGRASCRGRGVGVGGRRII